VDTVKTQLKNSEVRKGLGEPVNTEVLATAYAAGFLKISPVEGQTLLQGFWKLGAIPRAKDLQRLCTGRISSHQLSLRIWTDCDMTEQSINILHLTNLARLLLKSKNDNDRKQGFKLLMCASQANSPTATVFAVKIAHKQKQLRYPSVQPALNQLLKLTREGTYGPALVLQAKVYEFEGKDTLALQLYEKATRLKSFNPLLGATEHTAETALMGSDEVDNMDVDACDAWLAIGRIRLTVGSKLHDFHKAHEAFAAAALHYDDPDAYAYLANFEDEHTKFWMRCRLRAAASGHVDSAYAMGLLYSLPHEEVLAIKDEYVRNEVLNNSCVQVNPWWSKFSAWVRRDGPDLDGPRLKYASFWFWLAASRGHLDAQLAWARIAWQTGNQKEAYVQLTVILGEKLSKYERRWPDAHNRTLKLYESFQKTPEWPLFVATCKQTMEVHDIVVEHVNNEKNRRA